jgi:hypothetical protein
MQCRGAPVQPDKVTLSYNKQADSVKTADSRCIAIQKGGTSGLSRALSLPVRVQPRRMRLVSVSCQVV